MSPLYYTLEFLRDVAFLLVHFPTPSVPSVRFVLTDTNHFNNFSCSVSKGLVHLSEM